jgi:hypothetical protein
MDSILTSSKKLAGLTEEYEHFDPDIVMYINSVFLILKQIGVGPSEGFFIEDDSDSWSDFIPDNDFLCATVKAYMGSKVRMKFDPPTNPTLLKALADDIAESEWRLREEAALSNS